MKQAKYQIGDRVNATGMPGIGTVVLVEPTAFDTRYRIEYADADRGNRSVWAMEDVLMLVERGEKQP